VGATIIEQENGDSWALWRAELTMVSGKHWVAVRVIDREGAAQVEDERDVLPSGATGLHEIEITVA
jgi:hypothetical protein